VGINAGKVQDLNLRKAIMAAMDPELARAYYSANTVEMIAWPMSIVNWAYPKDASGKRIQDNGHDYADLDVDTDDQRIKMIEDYMKLAGVSSGDKSLKITFTIAGSNLTEHPTYETFKHAADLLNACGWDIEVIPDVNALNKLSTGALSVWAAAWGSSIDSDMYQVYHKNSTATSTTAWGYKAIKQNPGQYPREVKIIDELSELIDKGRETEDRADRSNTYMQAMSKVLDLAIELPIYQRKNLYAYNSKVIKTSSLPAVVNPYSSPLSRIWEVEIF
jgi:peptide/nickel transport system substrate-binding protein